MKGLPTFTVRFRSEADYETLKLIIEMFFVQNQSNDDYYVTKQVMEAIKAQGILLKQVYFNLEYTKGTGIGYDPISEEIRGELLFPSPLEDYQKILTNLGLSVPDNELEILLIQLRKEII